VEGRKTETGTHSRPFKKVGGFYFYLFFKLVLAVDTEFCEKALILNAIKVLSLSD